MKTSCFSLSAPLIKENFRRFWALPVVAFLAYFISGILPLLTNYKKLDNMAYLIDAMLNQSYSCYNALGLLVPIIAASLVFRYLHSTSSVTVMHALPFTRSSLFNTNLISGLILSVLPVLATGVMLLCLAKPTHYSSAIDYDPQFITLYGEMDTANQVNLFTHSQALIWLGTSLLIVLCVYAISIFAGALTGNAIIHFFTAIGFNFLGFILVMVVTKYFNIFLYGYKVSDDFDSFMAAVSPFTGVSQYSRSLPLWAIVCYIAFALLLIVLSAKFYRIRRLERTQNAFVFRIMDPIACYLITFFGMTVVGLALYRENESYAAMYAGIAGGSIAAFIIGRMVVKKTLRVFNTASLKSFALYAAAAVIFICFLAFDITGYETRVPDVSQINSILASDDTLGGTDGRFQSHYYKNGSKTGDDVYKTKDNIQAMREMHRLILKARPEGKENDIDCASITFKYQKPGLDQKRTYLLPNDFFKNSASYKKIFESNEFKSFYSLKNFKRIDNVRLSVSSQFLNEDASIKTAEQQQLLDCLEKDFAARTYAQQVNSKRSYGTVYLEYKTKTKSEDSDTDGLRLNILFSDTNTVEWLKGHGYSQYLEPQVSEIESVYVSKYDMEHYNGAPDDYANVNPFEGLGDTECYTKTVTVKEGPQIQRILNTCEEDFGPYECVINFKKNSRFYKQTPNFYFSKSSLPEFLKDKLK